MKGSKTFDNYPIWIVLVTNLFNVVFYGIGFYIIKQTYLVFALLFLGYCLFLEISVMRKSCVNCYYYGKVCGTGKGKVAKLLFRKGNERKFAEGEASFVGMVPEMLAFFIPIGFGAVMLFQKFNLVILILMGILFLMTSAGNAYIRGSLLCKYCKQRELGCPAEKLLNKNGKGE